jgi:uncharacterized membrane protein YccC
MQQLVRRLSTCGPPLLFGLRLWAAVVLALTVAFWLELDNASWAGTSAAIVCQPVLGASLRKGWFRMIGTLVGAIAIVVLTACFPQNRLLFLAFLVGWGALCAFVATILRNFASYAAALAGFTTVIVASDELGAVGGPNGDVFMLAVARATEICVGIVSAGVVLAATDFGQARLRFSKMLAGLATEITSRFIESFRLGPAEQEMMVVARRDLTRRVGELDGIIDQVLGESPDLRFNPRPLQAAMEGLFAALSSWRVVAHHLALLPEREGFEERGTILRMLPDEFQRVESDIHAAAWAAAPQRLLGACRLAIRALLAIRTESPSLRLLADRTATALNGVRDALLALVLLNDPRQVIERRDVARVRVPDLFPAVYNAVRAAITIAGAAVIWIVTQWPGGATAMTFAAVTVILLAPQAGRAYGAAKRFFLGTAISAVLAAIVGFAVLPALHTYAGFCFALALGLIPTGALMAQSWEPLVFLAATANFVPILSPTNQMSYDIEKFYNTAFEIVAGVGMTMLALRLMPPLAPEAATRRLLALTLKDLRRLMTGRIPRTLSDWEGRVYGRLAALPDQTDLLPRGQLAAALSVGTEITQLRRSAERCGLGAPLDSALAALAEGDSEAAIERLARFDDALRAIPAERPGEMVRMRARSAVLAVTEALGRHGDYFDWR